LGTGFSMMGAAEDDGAGGGVDAPFAGVAFVAPEAAGATVRAEGADAATEAPALPSLEPTTEFEGAGAASLRWRSAEDGVLLSREALLDG
jgi:hypothetical protein